MTITKEYLELVEGLVRFITDDKLDKSRTEFELTKRIQSFMEIFLSHGLAVIEVDDEEEAARINKSFHKIIPLIKETVGRLFWSGIRIQDPDDPNSYFQFDLVSNLMDLTDIIEDRLGDLSPLVTNQEIDETVALHLDEAHRAYRLGMDKAAILLAYSAVELQVKLTMYIVDQSLFINTPHRSLRKFDKDSNMDTFLKTFGARGVLSSRQINSINLLRTKRNQIAHRNPESEEFDIEVPIKNLINDAGKIVLHLMKALD